MSNLEPLMRQNFLDYASYVILDRAIPDIRDGCKPVQRRILHTLHEMNDGKFHKVANVIGETMKLHPHGDASIGAALVVLANKGYFIERQGNFGSTLTGHPPAAPRYIECRLTPLALDTVFNKNLTELSDSYDGRKKEPVFLPSKLPIVLLLGTEGIAVGMSTKILPHNLGELLKAQIKILKNKPFKIVPDFPNGGLADFSEYKRGKGKVKSRAKISVKNDKTIVIEELPHGVTTEGLISSIESAVQKGRIKISSIEDFTTDKAEIHVNMHRGVYSEEVIPQLYAHTDCEVVIHSNIVVIDNGRPAELSVNEILRALTIQLVDRIRAELKYALEQLLNKQHWMTLEQIFIENKVYKVLEKSKTSEAVRKNVWNGMMKFKKQFVREMTEEDLERLLRIPIRRISLYDIEKFKKDIGDVVREIKEIRKKLKNITQTTIDYLDGLVAKYAKDYPRKTKADTFEEIDVKKIANENIKMSYDPKTGFFGTNVRGSEHTFKITKFDRILIISKDGSYRIVGKVDKVLVGKIKYIEKFDIEEGAVFTVVYRNKQKYCFAKKIHIHKFINKKEYQLVKDGPGTLDILSEWEDPGELIAHYKPAPRQKVKSVKFNLSELEFTSTTARGIRIGKKPVSKIEYKEE